MTDESGVHLIVLHFGLWGNHKHLDFVEKTLVERLADFRGEKGEAVQVINPDWDRMWRTYDGIDQCGERVLTYLEKEYYDNPKVKRISFIGYSLGGLILRYAAGLLYHRGVIPSKWIPDSFVTIASPNLGVSLPANKFIFRLKDRLLGWALSKSGTQLVLKDKEIVYTSDGKTRALLVFMADPNYCFWQALKTFEQRVVFANVVNDRAVPFTSAAIEVRHTCRSPNVTLTAPYKDYPSIVKPASGTAVTAKEKRSCSYYGGWLLFILISPVILLLLLVAVCYLSFAGLRHRLLSYKLTPDPEWLKGGRDGSPKTNETDPEDALDSSVNSSSYKAASTERGRGTLPDEVLQTMLTPFSSKNSEIGLLYDRAVPTGDESLQEMDASDQRKYMARKLNMLPWTKVFVKCKFRNAHAAIIRRTYISRGNEDVVYYLADKVFKRALD